METFPFPPQIHESLKKHGNYNTKGKKKKGTTFFVQKHIAFPDYTVGILLTKKVHKTQTLFIRFAQTALLEKKKAQAKGVMVIIKNIVNGDSVKKTTLYELRKKWNKMNSFKLYAFIRETF